MSEIKQVWGIIKDYKCADLKMVQDPALAVFQHQQAIIDEHTEVIKLQDADLRKYEKQIEGLKAQLNNMEACYIGVKKERDELQGRIDEISGYATELAEYASYSEIIGAISHNREAVRVYCDKIFAYNRAIDIEEEKALRGES